MISKTLGYGIAAPAWAMSWAMLPAALATAFTVKAATAPYCWARKVGQEAAQ
jgi:hypothetical protein